jgi:hypothetical protein
MPPQDNRNQDLEPALGRQRSEARPAFENAGGPLPGETQSPGPSGTGGGGGRRPPPPLEDLQIELDDLVVLGEDGRFYLITQKEYMATRLPDSLRSVAEFVVGLGAVVADLGDVNSANDASLSALTQGFRCIVLNAAAIVNRREKQGRPRVTSLPKGIDGDTCKVPPALLEEPDIPLSLTGNDSIDDKDIVVFEPDGRFYWIKYEDHLNTDTGRVLPEGMRSAPELMISLGTLVADIPSLPTVGCACKLLNLRALRHSHL